MLKTSGRSRSWHWCCKCLLLVGKVHDLSEEDFIGLIVQLEGIEFRLQIRLRVGSRVCMRSYQGNTV